MQVIRFNPETQRISLGMKQLEADPWEGVELKYPAGTRFKGRVTNITDYGAFVELEPGVEGLVHVSEMSWTKKNVHPGKIVSTSQEVEVMVLDVDPTKRRISLGLKQTMQNPWEAFAEKYPVGTEVEGEVRNITEFGLFVGLVRRHRRHGASLRHRLAEAGRGRDQRLQEGRHGAGAQFSTSMSRRSGSASASSSWRPIRSNSSLAAVKKGDVVTSTVTAIMETGIEVQLASGLAGFIRKSELSRDRAEQRPDRFAVGEKVDAKVTQLDRATRKATLSIKSREVDEEKKAMAEFGSSDSGASLGDILGAAMNRARAKGERDDKDEKDDEDEK